MLHFLCCSNSPNIKANHYSTTTGKVMANISVLKLILIVRPFRFNIMWPVVSCKNNHTQLSYLYFILHLQISIYFFIAYMIYQHKVRKWCQMLQSRKASPQHWCICIEGDMLCQFITTNNICIFWWQSLTTAPSSTCLLSPLHGFW